MHHRFAPERDREFSAVGDADMRVSVFGAALGAVLAAVFSTKTRCKLLRSYWTNLSGLLSALVPRTTSAYIRFIVASLWLFASALVNSQEVDAELRALLADTINTADSFEDRFDAEVWLVQKSGVLKKYIKDEKKALSLLKEIHKAASRAKIPPEFVLAVIEVESAFDRFAISSAGAQGLMQVMPFWKKEIGREQDNLIDAKTNLRYGCTILKYYLDKSDNHWAEALARYNGSYGKLWYPTRVMNAWDEHWR